MKLSIPITEMIQKRHSVRTYEDQALSPQDRAALVDCMNQLDNPFGVSVHKYIIDKKLSSNGEKLGTYGVIRGWARCGWQLPSIGRALLPLWISPRMSCCRRSPRWGTPQPSAA